MEIFLFTAAAVAGYLIAGFNPAIALSKAIYRKDIREYGSGNPGFTNFKRTFGGKWAWVVLLIDLFKAAATVGTFAFLFGRYLDEYQLGAAYTGFFAMLGHAYPIAYKFKGGKSFLVCLSSMWVLEPVAGLIATVIMILLLLTTKYMSLSTVIAMWSCPVVLAVMNSSVEVICLCTASVAFMTLRHRENFKRLIKGTENKFLLKS